MTKMTFRRQQFFPVGLIGLAASALLPMPASAGGRGTAEQPQLSVDSSQLQTQLSALDSRIAELEKKAGEELASSDDATANAPALKLTSRQAGTSATAQAAGKPGL